MNIVELHSEAWAQLGARRAQLPHSLLISGQRGIGKFDLARRFTESLLCESPTASGEALISAITFWSPARLIPQIHG